MKFMRPVPVFYDPIMVKLQAEMKGADLATLKVRFEAIYRDYLVFKSCSGDSCPRGAGGLGSYNEDGVFISHNPEGRHDCCCDMAAEDAAFRLRYLTKLIEKAGGKVNAEDGTVE